MSLTDLATELHDLWERDDPADGSRDIEFTFDSGWYGWSPYWTVSLREGADDELRWHRFLDVDLASALSSAIAWCEDLLLLKEDQ